MFPESTASECRCRARHASRIVEPSGTVARWPSMTTSTGGAAGRPAPEAGSGAAAAGTRSARDSRLPSGDGQAKDGRLHGARRGLPEPADGRVTHHLPEILEERQLLRVRADRRQRAAARAALPAAPSRRHGTHWPHDSSRKNSAMRRTMSTRSTDSPKCPRHRAEGCRSPACPRRSAPRRGRPVPRTRRPRPRAAPRESSARRPDPGCRSVMPNGAS